MSRRAAAILLIVFWIFAFTLTHVPTHGSGWISDGLRGLPLPADKLAHVGIYFCLAGLVANFIGRWTRSKRILVPTTFLVTLTYGVLDELLQMLVPSRSADLHDLYADAVGIVLGIVVFIGLRIGKDQWHSRKQADQMPTGADQIVSNASLPTHPDQR